MDTLPDERTSDFQFPLNQLNDNPLLIDKGKKKLDFWPINKFATDKVIRSQMMDS